MDELELLIRGKETSAPAKPSAISDVDVKIPAAEQKSRDQGAFSILKSEYEKAKLGLANAKTPAEKLRFQSDIDGLKKEMQHMGMGDVAPQKSPMSGIRPDLQPTDELESMIRGTAPAPQEDLSAAEKPYFGTPRIAKRPGQPQQESADLRPLYEVPRAILQNLPAMAASGYSALAGAVLPGPPGQGAQWQKETMQKYGYEPESEGSKRVLEALNLPMEYLSKGAKYVGDIAQQVTGSPTVGGVVQGGLEGAPMLMGLRRTPPPALGTPIIVRPAAPSVTDVSVPAVTRKAQQTAMTVTKPQILPAQQMAEMQAQFEAKKAGLKPIVEAPAPAAPVGMAAAVSEGAEPLKKAPEAPVVGNRNIVIPEENPVMPSAVTPADVASRADVLSRVGLENVRKSALENNPKQASSQYITAKSSEEPYGVGMTNQINYEKQTLNNHFQKAEQDAGGTVVRYGTPFQETDKIKVGQTVKNALDEGFTNHLKEGKRLYSEADRKMGNKPVQISQFDDFLKKDQNFVYENEKNLKNGIRTYLKDAGHLDKDGNIMPMTVKQAEDLRQYINHKYHYETSALAGRLKGLIDNQVFEQVGGETYQKARKHWATGKETYENPKAVGDLLSDKGVNQKIPDEKVISKVITLPESQFAHLFNTLKADKQTGAVNQIKTSLINQIRMAGQSAVNEPWNSIAAAKEAASLGQKLQVAFADNPAVLNKIMDGLEAGNILHIPTKYPGAAVQTHLLKNKFSEIALQKLGTAAGGALGTTVGTAVGAPVLGGGAGAMIGEKIGAGRAEAAKSKRQTKQLGKEITTLGDMLKEQK